MIKHIICLLGPAGSGKSTQLELLAQKLSIQEVEMSTLFKQEVAKKSEISDAISDYILRGINIPKDITHKVITRNLKIDESKEYLVFSNFPRSVEQLEILNEICLEYDMKLFKFIVMNLSVEESIKRIQNRIATGDYRKDDLNVDAIKNRLDAFYSGFEDMKESLDRFEEGIVVEIDASQSIEKIHIDILEILK